MSLYQRGGLSIGLLTGEGGGWTFWRPRDKSEVWWVLQKDLRLLELRDALGATPAVP